MHKEEKKANGESGGYGQEKLENIEQLCRSSGASGGVRRSASTFSLQSLGVGKDE